MLLGIISDIHLYRKTDRLVRALDALKEAEVLLLCGDLADRALSEQYVLLAECIRQRLGNIPVYCVMGNHDNPARDDSHFRKFERTVNPEMTDLTDESGAFYKQISDEIDLIGLNPEYHQKQFFFSQKGKQLDFLFSSLAVANTRIHIIMCHPPLIEHNPLRKNGMAPYIVGEQNDKLQRILDDAKHTIFISGHTHVFPHVEWDSTHGNLYINNGSICPTVDESCDTPRQGNVTLLNITSEEISILIKGIYNGKIFYSETRTL